MPQNIKDIYDHFYLVFAEAPGESNNSRPFVLGIVGRWRSCSGLSESRVGNRVAVDVSSRNEPGKMMQALLMASGPQTPDQVRQNGRRISRQAADILVVGCGELVAHGDVSIPQ